MLEIERKYEVTSNEFKNLSVETSLITQGYLSKDINRTVRVRTVNNTGILTIKGIGNESGTTRQEYEVTIDFEMALQLLLLCDKPLIIKNRYIVPYDGLTIEVDEFLNGMVIAEIELDSEDQQINVPSWFGEELTGNPKYYNSNM